ncbi:MAG: cytochrome c oxidase subunit II [Caldilineaceae bacterium]|nr:cytochrome c oxidase subunit II [Caldilineaceae bacterium]
MSEHEQDAIVEDGSSETAADQAGHEEALHVEAPQETASHLHIDRYEAAWIRISVGVLVVFMIAVTISSFAIGIQLPGVYDRINPNELYEPGSPFAEPGLRELAPGKYEAYFRGQIWSFVPNEIHVPVGSEVTFYVTSQDVQHGFKITETNVNVMVLPGQISTLKHTFDEAGEYQIICHEYCGQLHHTMYATIYVEEDAPVADAQ